PSHHPPRRRVEPPAPLLRRPPSSPAPPLDRVFGHRSLAFFPRRRTSPVAISGSTGVLAAGVHHRRGPAVAGLARSTLTGRLEVVSSRRLARRSEHGRQPPDGCLTSS